MSEIEQFRQSIVDAGLEAPMEIIADGAIHRFSSNGKRGDMAGWYCLFLDGVAAGSFGCWREGIKQTWSAKTEQRMSRSEVEEYRRRIKVARETAEAMRKAEQEKAVSEACRRWEAAKPSDPSHPYLRRKGIKAHGLRQEGDLLLVPVWDVAGGWQSLQTISPVGRKRFLPGGKMKGGMFWLGERQAGDPVLLAEGWATAATLHEATGYLVVVCFNAGNLQPVAKELREKMPDTRLIICADNDQGTTGNPGLTKGRKAAQAVGAAICWPESIEGTDFNDMASQRGLKAVTDTVKKAGEGAADYSDDTPLVITRCLADVTPEPVTWLWPGRIAKGKVTMIAGHPGLGKSQLTAGLAATVTIGGAWPADQVLADIGNVVFLNAEDDAADTLRPRLDAAGADVRRCHVLDAILDREGKPRGFSLGQDLEALEALLDRLGGVALVVVDPITAYLGGVDSHKNSDIRALLAPLSDLAARHRVAVVCVSHLNKAGGTDALLRVSGSLAFTAAARAAWLVAKDPQDEGRRLFLPMKNNLGPDATGLAFHVEGVPLENGIATSRISWESEPVSIDANDALFSVDDGERTERDEVAAWLRQILADGPVKAQDLLKDARQCGYSERTLRRAKTDVGAKSFKQSFSKGWFWGLSEDCQHEDCQPLRGNLGSLRGNPHGIRDLTPSEGGQYAEGCQHPVSGHLRGKVAASRRSFPWSPSIGNQVDDEGDLNV